MRRAAKIDQNHREIVDALRRAGVSILDLSAVGRGCPDLLCCRGELTRLMEVKRPKAKGQRAGTLAPAQIAFRAAWPAEIAVVDSVESAIAAMGLKASKVDVGPHYQAGTHALLPRNQDQ